MLSHEQQILSLHENHSMSDEDIAMEMELPLEKVQSTLARYAPKTYGIPESEKERIQRMCLEELEYAALDRDPAVRGSKVKAVTFLWQEVNNRNDLKRADGPQTVHYHVHDVNKAIEASRRAKEKVVKVEEAA